jgi:hypothetical protein
MVACAAAVAAFTCASHHITTCTLELVFLGEAVLVQDACHDTIYTHTLYYTLQHDASLDEISSANVIAVIMLHTIW